MPSGRVRVRLSGSRPLRSLAARAFQSSSVGSVPEVSSAAIGSGSYGSPGISPQRARAWAGGGPGMMDSPRPPTCTPRPMDVDPVTANQLTVEFVDEYRELDPGETLTFGRMA